MKKKKWLKRKFRCGSVKTNATAKGSNTNTTTGCLCGCSGVIVIVVAGAIVIVAVVVVVCVVDDVAGIVAVAVSCSGYRSCRRCRCDKGLCERPCQQ
eukprot:m.14583 g.14583  ORF g.14583 m.14583 type:complete len:97 (+) comp4848_c0_seq1:39-329(+)